ncbi:MAG TPA: helix-turn-helix transcriptional regulator [Candidatus Cloacimonadota bacterium]|nr:helix-turn-helix transcriptional regulator [Candidatus Cloacimonadota bacterium]
MESLSLYLKELREKKGISLDKIREDLLIPAEKILQMEAGDWEALGEYGIRKAMVYNYARYLEADIYAVMTEFDLIYPPENQAAPTMISVPKEKRIMLSTNFIWMVVISVIVIILGSIIFVAYKNGFLESPQLFSKDDKDSTEVAAEIPEEIEPAVPDSTRTRMLELTQMLKPNPQTEEEKQESHKQEIISDNTDYMGKFLGDNPMNVDIH